MKILIASDSFKGSASTLEVANSMERGIRSICKEVETIKLPVADGGEGTVDALVIGLNGEYREEEVTDPLGRKIKSKYGIINEDTAIVEMAQASGLTLLNEDELNPLKTTTYGTGELIKFAMESGVRKIFIGLGGSGTNDGGVGMAQALGISFKDKNGFEVKPGGGQLKNIDKIDFKNKHPLLAETEIKIISDVDNPLCGPDGASYIYGPQKGADEEMVELLDGNLFYLGKKIEEFTGKKVMDIKGSGAAGGLGAGLIGFCNASIYQGIELILDIIHIDEHLKTADLVITGEGKIDRQSIFGKVPVGVAKRAKKYNLPVIAITGNLEKGGEVVYKEGIDLIIDIINKPMELRDAMEEADELIEIAASKAMRVVEMCRKYKL